MKKTEVLIVGGGIIGSSIAYYLSKHGVEVTVVEKGKLLGGASGANQGGIPVSLFEPPLLDLVRESRKLYDGLSQELGEDLGFDETGLLLIVLDKDQESLLNQFGKRLEQRGLGAESLSSNELQAESLLADNVKAAVKTSADASVDPFKVGFGLISQAKANGATFLKDTEVKDVIMSGRKVTQVKTTRETLQLNYLVNAAGARSKSIGDMVGLDIPVKPRRGQILVTEPTPRAKYRYLMDFDYIATALGNGDKEEKSRRMKLGVASSLIQEPSSNWTIGASRDFAGFNKKTTRETLGYLADRATKFLPDFENCNIIRSYAGLRPYCHVDGKPILGRIEELDNFFIATGHAGEGITLAPITGKLLAREIVSGRKAKLLDSFRYSRFESE
ncbi:FAD-binding oxidoreductase [Candidatus Bipolaricaulota bacterium]|nr:FAD-binding oxidoreductase [Candidatus Bipolaricaulota bacterium]